MNAKQKIFISYSHEDKKCYRDFRKHLNVLEEKKIADVSDDSKVQPGDSLSKKIFPEIEDSTIFVALVSHEYLCSPFCKKELEKAFKLESAGKIIIIPIIIRSCNWEIIFGTDRLAILEDEEPILECKNKDKAFTNTIKKINKRFEDMNSKQEEDIGKGSMGKTKIKTITIRKGDIGKDNMGKSKIKTMTMRKGDIGKDNVGKTKIKTMTIRKGDIGKDNVGKSKIKTMTMRKGDIGKDNVGKSKIKTMAIRKEDISKNDVEKLNLKPLSVFGKKIYRKRKAIKYKTSVKQYDEIVGSSLEAVRINFSTAEKERFTVLLCGPEINDKNPTCSGKLREKLLNALEKAKFEVVLGEDDGLEDIRLKYGFNAQDNELNFIIAKCDAIIIIPSSPGSFCELGLFSWHYVNDDGLIKKVNKNAERDIEILILVDEQFKRKKSYLNEGPFKSLRGLGHIDYVDYNNCKTHNVDIGRIKDILINQRNEKMKAMENA